MSLRAVLKLAGTLCIVRPIWCSSWPLLFGWIAFGLFGGPGLRTRTAIAQETEAIEQSFAELSERYCIDCHSGSYAEARLDLVELNATPIEQHYRDWQRVLRVLSEQSMPPQDAEQPEPNAVTGARAELESALALSVRAAASDPGPTVIRRLTNAEFDYCIEDLTGVRLNLGKQLVSDSVGGSGFTNSATAQFMQDATFERYLEAAKLVADHAMIGSGPLYFFSDPGQTGLELSAIRRIQKIYRQYGFRISAGEGAKPYGLERIPRAFEVAWRFQNRKALGTPEKSLRDFASQADVEVKFAEHIWEVLHRDEARFPLTEIIQAWQDLPVAQEILRTESAQEIDEEIASHAAAIYEQIQQWQSKLAASTSDEEEAALLSTGSLSVPSEANFAARGLRKRLQQDDNFTPDINNEQLYSEDGRVRFRLWVEAASPDVSVNPVVIFSEPKFRFRIADEVEREPVPLRTVLKEEAARVLQFGRNPQGEPIAGDAFVVPVGQSKIIEVELPRDCRVGELRISARLDEQLGRDSVVRCLIKDITNEGDPDSRRPGREYSSMLRTANSRILEGWQAGLEEFANALPQISHREPAPSDRDPIPAPYENTYNLPERNFFHTAVKYYRDDKFLTEHILPKTAREQLDHAWTDLLTSFDYHDVNLRFVAKKYGVELGDHTIATINTKWINHLPNAIRPIVREYQNEYQAMQSMLRAAQQQHLQDVCDFASRAWRRPLTRDQRQELLDFYRSVREDSQLNHAAAIRSTLTRILVSPDFLYRLERYDDETDMRPLDPFELATRLSFSIWSSLPDEELIQLAKQKRLHDPEVLRQQVKRMLRSPRARRLATEFFGQWLGFYQFDQFRGVDVERFPEFDERLKTSLYDEAISFFEHILREDRPYTEILQADYSFIDRRAADHYGIEWPRTAVEHSVRSYEDDRAADWTETRKIQVSERRGGLLGMAAILTSTSAPLRTSPVKRGDWILRRLIGTPVPPPPADAGSIAAEEVLEDGLTVRQRLEAHRNSPECMNCHVRIDPLGFALENFDSLGRWRDTYLDDQSVDASAVTADGTAITGIEGLKRYLGAQDALIRRTLATNLVAYFLGRAETISDAALIDRITQNLESDPSISTAIITLVQSPQFRAVRGRSQDRSSATPKSGAATP